MHKRLMLVLCALLVVAMALPAFAAVQNVKVSGDITARYIGRTNFDLGKGSGTAREDEMGLFNTITRLRVDADLTENVQTVVRLINERNWDEAGVSNTDIDLDLAYVTLKEFLYAPLTLAIGRQELHFGNDMIIGDGVGTAPAGAIIVSGGIGTNQNTNYTEATGWQNLNGDLSLRKSFDAIRATLNYDPLIIDLVYAKIDANLAVGGGATPHSDDVNLYGINAGYQFKDKWSTKGEGYLFIKAVDSNAVAAVTADKADTVYNLGGRVNTNPSAKLNLQQEIAWQGGKKGYLGIVRERNAWASQSMVTVVPGWKHNPVMGLIYSYFSGDANVVGTDPDKKYHQWDPMFENQTAGHIVNALFAQSNCHDIDLMLKLTPDFAKDVTLRADWVYVALAKANSSVLANVNDYNTPGQNLVAGKKVLGQELDLNLTYDYTEDVQFGLLTGWFFPGKAIQKSATQSREVAREAIVSCKVAF